MSAFSCFCISKPKTTDEVELKEHPDSLLVETGTLDAHVVKVKPKVPKERMMLCESADQKLILLVIFSEWGKDFSNPSHFPGMNSVECKNALTARVNKRLPQVTGADSWQQVANLARHVVGFGGSSAYETRVDRLPGFEEHFPKTDVIKRAEGEYLARKYSAEQWYELQDQLKDVLGRVAESNDDGKFPLKMADVRALNQRDAGRIIKAVQRGLEAFGKHHSGK